MKIFFKLEKVIRRSHQRFVILRFNDQSNIHETISDHKLKLKGHCNRMPIDEPINRFVIYVSKSSLPPKAPAKTF